MKGNKDIDKLLADKLGLPEYIWEQVEKKESKVVIGVRLVKHRRKVTFIRGLGKDEKKLKEIVKELKRKLACGGSIKEDEKTGELEVILQGDHRKRVVEELNNMGYKNIEVL